MNLLVTGPAGVGKTTAMQRLVERLRADGRRLAGVLSDEVRKVGRRVGFRIGALGGEPRIMAHESFVSPKRVGPYGVDVEIINYVVDTTLRIVDYDVIIIDEIGKMECFSQRFVTAVETLLSRPIPVVATGALSGSGFFDEVKKRSDCELVHIALDNRDHLPAALADRLG